MKGAKEWLEGIIIRFKNLIIPSSSNDHIDRIGINLLTMITVSVHFILIIIALYSLSMRLGFRHGRALAVCSNLADYNNKRTVLWTCIFREIARRGSTDFTLKVGVLSRITEENVRALGMVMATSLAWLLIDQTDDSDPNFPPSYMFILSVYVYPNVPCDVVIGYM